MVAPALSDRRTHVCHRRPPGHRLFVVSVHRAQLPLLRPFHAPTHAANAAVKSPLAHGGASPATRTDSPPDRPSTRRGRPAWPSSAFSGDCLYTGEQCSAVGLTSAGLDGRTDAAMFWREGGSYCCNSYESARFRHCCQVCECLPCCWISHRMKTKTTLSIDSRCTQLHRELTGVLISHLAVVVWILQWKKRLPSACFKPRSYKLLNSRRDSCVTECLFRQRAVTLRVRNACLRMIPLCIVRTVRYRTTLRIYADACVSAERPQVVSGYM